MYFSKAFDSVWRIGLWQKLLKSNIDGTFLKVVINMYTNVKLRILHSSSNNLSEAFLCNCGVRQVIIYPQYYFHFS